MCGYCWTLCVNNYVYKLTLFIYNFWVYGCITVLCLLNFRCAGNFRLLHGCDNTDTCNAIAVNIILKLLKFIWTCKLLCMLKATFQILNGHCCGFRYLFSWLNLYIRDISEDKCFRDIHFKIKITLKKLAVS